MPFIKCPFCFRRHPVHRDAGGTYINCSKLEGMHHYLSKTYIIYNNPDDSKKDEIKSEVAAANFVQLELEI